MIYYNTENIENVKFSVITFGQIWLAKLKKKFLQLN